MGRPPSPYIPTAAGLLGHDRIFPNAIVRCLESDMLQGDKETRHKDTKRTEYEQDCGGSTEVMAWIVWPLEECISTET